MLTVSVIVKRNLSGENASRVMIHKVLWVVFFIIYEIFLSLSRSTGHQQHAIGLSMVNAIFIILNVRKLKAWHELNSCIEITKERLIWLTCWIFWFSGQNVLGKCASMNRWHKINILIEIFNYYAAFFCFSFAIIRPSAFKKGIS